MLEKFSRQAVKILENAKKIADEMGAKITSTEHLLLAMYQIPDSICAFLLNEHSINEDILKKAIQEFDADNILLNKNKKYQEGEKEHSVYSVKLQEIVVKAEEFVTLIGNEYVFDEHLFYIILEDKCNKAREIIISLGLETKELIKDIEEIFDFKNEKKVEPFLFLTNMSEVRITHPYINIGNYLNQIDIIMNKLGKNNPMLIGASGVGKSAIVEGYALKEKGTTIYRLDLGTIMAGTKYRGELEEKIIKAMNFIKDKKAILFIDEIHNIVGAGSNEGTLDIANILKPYLARNDIRCIGATTSDEYYKFIDKDKALVRRFQNIFISEPSIDETIYILNNIKSSYEKYHKIEYSNDIINYIVTTTSKFILNKSFPDKAIDVMDEVGARYFLNKSNVSINKKELVDEVILSMTGISMIKEQELAKQKLNYPELFPFYKRFYNKDFITKNLVSIYKIKLNIENLIVDLANVFSFRKEMMLEIDLTTYFESTTISTLIGTPKGYVGYDSGGILSEHIIKHPLSLIYFKNIDKAHHTVKNFILKLKNDSSFYDNKNRVIYLNNTILIYSNDKKTNNNYLGLINNQKKENIKEFDIII